MKRQHLLDVFAAAASAPGATALVHPQGTMSYRELARLSAQALCWLRRRVGEPSRAGTPRAPVPVLAIPSVEQVALTYALLARGTPVLPVHPRLSASERRRLLDAVNAELLVAPGWSDERVFETKPRVTEVDSHPEDIQALVQTSGSSSVPRLACLSRRALLASARASAQHLGWLPHDRWLLALPFAHVGGLSILTRCLAARKSVVLADPGSTENPAVRLAHALNTQRVTLLSLVPTQVEQLLALDAWRPAPGLRAILVGGAACSEATLERATARQLVLLPSYGMTETCSQICTRSLTRYASEAGVGRPLAGIEVRIIDRKIEVRGEVLYSGYWSKPGLQSPHAWYPTGDLGRLDESGCLHVIGRSSDVIITGGENVDPAEVEAVLRDLCAPRRIAVYGAEDPLWGQRVTLAVEGAYDSVLVCRIQQLVTDQLASFKRPRLVAFVNQLPELASGKVARRLLDDSCAEALISLKKR